MGRFRFSLEKLCYYVIAFCNSTMPNYTVLRRPVFSTAVHIFKLGSSHLVFGGANKVFQVCS